MLLNIDVCIGMNFTEGNFVICTKIFEICIFFNPDILYPGIYTVD